MASNRSLDGLKVAILLTNGFEQAEYTEPRKALEDAGAKVTVFAPKAGEAYGMKHHDKADKIKVDRPLSEARPEEFDAVLLPGGALNADALRVEEAAREFVKAFEREGKPIAVICHGPWLLVSADLVDGHTLTSYHTIQDDIRNAGGKWVDEQVVRDRNWVSSRQPSDIPAFNEALMALFAGGKARASGAS